VSYQQKETAHHLLYCQARLAGLNAAEACKPTPMIVSQHKNMLDDSSPIEKQWYVPSGVCGFAWVIVRPGTSSFAKWLVKNGHARTHHYYGGICHYVSEFGQSMEVKEAYATAFAKVLSEAGIRAYSDSRMD
jgi:hypothetical protein